MLKNVVSSKYFYNVKSNEKGVPTHYATIWEKKLSEDIQGRMYTYRLRQVCVFQIIIRTC